MNQHISGLVAAPFTPMRDDGSLDLEQVRPYAEFLARNGVNGVFVNGSTGEFASMTLDERLRHAAQWAKESPSELNVLVHVGGTCLEDCRTMMKHAGEIGASGAGALAPYYFKPSSIVELTEWCAAVASAAPGLPFYYYHIPSRSGVCFNMREFLPAAAKSIPNLAGVKFTYEDLEDFQACVELDGGRFSILFGRDELLLSALERGATGAIGTTYSFAAPVYNGIIDNFRRGEKKAAEELQQAACRMIKVTHKTHKGMAAFKAVMGMIGMPCGPVRLPLTPMAPSQLESYRADLESIGFFDFCNR